MKVIAAESLTKKDFSLRSQTELRHRKERWVSKELWWVDWWKWENEKYSTQSEKQNWGAGVEQMFNWAQKDERSDSIGVMSVWRREELGLNENNI